MRHTLKESILQGPVHFYVGPGRGYLCRLLSGEALHRYDHKQTKGRVAMPKPLVPPFRSCPLSADERD